MESPERSVTLRGFFYPFKILKRGKLLSEVGLNLDDIAIETKDRG
jgi:hypothetical protein